MRFYYFVIFISIHLADAQYSVLSSALTTTARGLGQTGICDWSPQSGLMNAAHLSSLEYHNFGLEAHNYFYVDGLYTFAMNGTYKLDANSGFGINMITDGSPELKDWLFSLSYGRKLGAKTGIGLSIDYLQTQRPESNNFHNVSFELGLQTKLLPSLLVGFVLKNPVPIKTSQLYPYPVIFKAGVNYKAYEELQILAEIQKHGNQNTSLHCGLKYTPIPALDIALGVNTSGSIVSMGVAFKLKNNIILSTAFEEHSILGISSSFGFNYSFR